MVLDRPGELLRMRELPHPKLPLIPKHEIIGTVVEKEELAEGFGIGQRIGVPCLGYTYSLQEANRALGDLGHGRITGATVLTMDR